MQQVGGAYADPAMKIVLMPTTAVVEATLHSMESNANTLMEGTCAVVEHGETMTVPAGSTGVCFEMHVGTGTDSTYTIATSGHTGMAIYTAHVPTEVRQQTRHTHGAPLT